MPIHLLKIEPKRTATRLSISELKPGAGAADRARGSQRCSRRNAGCGSGRRERQSGSSPATSSCSRRRTKKPVEVSRALREAEVPFAFYKQDGLFQTDEAREVRDLLAAIADPADRREARSRLDHPVLRRSAGRPAGSGRSARFAPACQAADRLERTGRQVAASRPCSREFSTTAASSAASCSSRTTSGR